MEVTPMRSLRCSWGDRLTKHNQEYWECKVSKTWLMWVQRERSHQCRVVGLKKLEETRTGKCSGWEARTTRTEARSYTQLISTACLRTWPVRTGSRRQVRPEPVKWTRCGRSYSFPPVLSFNVVADTFSHGFLLKWSRDYADGYVSLVCGREKEKQNQ